MINKTSSIKIKFLPQWTLFFLTLILFVFVFNQRLSLAEICGNRINIKHEYGQKIVYVGKEMKAFVTDSSSVETVDYFGVLMNVLLIKESSGKIDNSDHIDRVAYKYRLVKFDLNCIIYATPLIGNGNKPIVWLNNNNVYLYFKPGNDQLYQSSIESDLVYGAGYYKVDLAARRFDKIDINPETAALLDAFGDK